MKMSSDRRPDYVRSDTVKHKALVANLIPATRYVISAAFYLLIYTYVPMTERSLITTIDFCSQAQSEEGTRRPTKKEEAAAKKDSLDGKRKREREEGSGKRAGSGGKDDGKKRKTTKEPPPPKQVSFTVCLVEGTTAVYDGEYRQPNLKKFVLFHISLCLHG